MRYGYVAAQAPRRYSTFDLFTDKGMRIRVKASRKGCRWLVGQGRPEPTLIYCLVDFEGGDTGTAYVMPNRIVRDAIDAYYGSRISPADQGSLGAAGESGAFVEPS